MIIAEGNAGYRVGDRVQKIDRRSVDDHVHPGERGFVAAAPGLGGITVYWDSGMERAVTDERMTRPVPPGEELKIFNGTPCLQLGDSQAEWDAHCEENARLVSAMEGFAERKGCMWAVKRTFLDDAHKSRSRDSSSSTAAGSRRWSRGATPRTGWTSGSAPSASLMRAP